MADKDKNYTKIANEILESMAKTKLSPTQYRILFVVWRNTYGYQREEHRMSLSYIASATGCDKRSIQRELKKMIEMKILNESYERQTRVLGFNKNFDQWLTIGKTANGKTANGEFTKKTIGKIANNTIGEIANQKRKNKERTKENRKEVFDYYLSLGLIQHKKYTPAMDNAIKTAMENYGYTIQYCKILLDRHKRVVEKTKNSEYPVRPRPLHEFFGQKVYGGKHLICADYEEGGRYYKKLEDDGVYTRVIDLPGLGKRKPDNLLERVKEREKEEAERMAREASHGA